MTSSPELKEELWVTEGHLTGHLGKMEEAGTVTVENQFVDRKPRTASELTPDGREKFEVFRMVTPRRYWFIPRVRAHFRSRASEPPFVGPIRWTRRLFHLVDVVVSG